MLDKPNSTTYRIFDFIVSYKRRHDGVSPTVEEIGNAVNLVKSSAYYHLLMLRDIEKIRFTPGQSRSIEVIGGEWRIVT